MIYHIFICLLYISLYLHPKYNFDHFINPNFIYSLYRKLEFINTLKKGDFFGERALEDSQGKRTANIIANPRDDGGKAICIKSYY